MGELLENTPLLFTPRCVTQFTFHWHCKTKFGGLCGIGSGDKEALTLGIVVTVATALTSPSLGKG